MNLVSNASEAIEGSGNVMISTENRYIKKPFILEIIGLAVKEELGKQKFQTVISK